MNPLRLVGPRTLTVVLALLALELFSYHGLELGRWTVMEQNERLGWRMLPSQDAWSRELDVEEQINAFGFRGREWTLPPPGPDGAPIKDDGLYRVAIVGNSIAYGMGVAIDDTFGRVVERGLQAELDRRGDPRRAFVMNFSVQGYVFEQMARVYEDEIRPFKPDLLIVPHHPHDITPLGPSADDAEYDFRTWVIRSATFELLNRHVINRWIPPVRKPKEVRRQAALNAALEHEISNKPFDPSKRPYWDAFLARLEGVRAEVRADGGRLLVLALPRWRKLMNPRVLSSTTGVASFVREHEDVILVDPFEEFERRMAPVVAEIEAKGVDVKGAIDLRARLAAAGATLETAELNLFLPYDLGHYSAAGHAVIGVTILQALEEAGLP